MFKLRFVTTIILCFLFALAHPVYSDSHQVQIENFLKWIMNNSDPKTGLPYSHMGDERYEKWCITYDAAVIALAYMACQKIEQARAILDFYRTNKDIWRLGGLIGGVYAPTGSGVSWLVWCGENIWMGIASFRLYERTHQKEYLDFAERIAWFIISLQNNEKDDVNYGGIPLGPAGNSNIAADQHLNYEKNQPGFQEVFASEHNIDAYALLNMLYFETEEEQFKEARDKVFRWITEVAYNPAENRLNRGCREKIDTAIASDVHSWAVSALGVNVLDSIEPGLAEKLLEFVENNCVSRVDYTRMDGQKVVVQGVDFTDKEAAKRLKRQPMVSPEWTFQFVNACNMLGDHLLSIGEQGRSEKYHTRRSELIEEMLRLAVPNDSGLAYPYATLADSPTGHGNMTPGKDNLSAIGAAWAVLSLSEADPLAF
ncbi:MAG: hypothetical protein JW869_08080 [Candidatus Omnitrophica bacterium]|nr:hypothetical protein [Candidatus Omnitrophota bacterium]